MERANHERTHLRLVGTVGREDRLSDGKIPRDQRKDSSKILRDMFCATRKGPQLSDQTLAMRLQSQVPEVEDTRNIGRV